MLNKRAIQFLLFLTISINGFSQVNKYQPFPDTNAIWRVDGNDCSTGGPYSSSYQYIMQGDTIIGAYKYNKIYLSGLVSQPCVQETYVNYYFCGLRQDSIAKKVFFIYNGYSDTLLYDFNLQVGDTVRSVYCHWNTPLGYMNQLKIIAIDSILLGNKYHKRFKTNASTYIIEGVGGSAGLFEPLITFETFSNLVCFSHNTEVYPNTVTACPLINNPASINQFKDFNAKLLIHPNPANSFFTIKYNDKSDLIDEAIIYNCIGEIVVHNKKIFTNQAYISISTLPQGTYILKIITEKKNQIMSKITVY
ncbi:MAG TPA: T9SS type A sorting domain-containing protein [Bacteroidia bacterium]|jgi:hypothetical protein|nr:T9SS type A sorting domain-containing protein [Bacteroidia bacterium]